MSSSGTEKCSVQYDVYIKTAESVEGLSWPDFYFVLGGWVGGWVGGNFFAKFFRLPFTSDVSGRPLKLLPCSKIAVTDKHRQVRYVRIHVRVRTCAGQSSPRSALSED